jgi:hypothetical protein
LWFSGWGSGWSAEWLVVLGGVEGELAEDLAGGGLDDADVEVVDEEQDGGSGEGSSEADVVEPAVVAQGDAAGVVDAVAADAVVGVVAAVSGAGFGAGSVGDAGQSVVG